MCNKCSDKICYDCNDIYHPGMSCKENQEIVFRRKEYQFCPKCNSKTAHYGNNRMSCRQCTYEWCWVCLHTYNDSHSWMCNPFGCKIARRSVLRAPCIRNIFFVLYLMLLVILIPLAILLFLPCGFAYIFGDLTFKYFMSNQIYYDNRFTEK